VSGGDCKYGISYRDLEEMMSERCIEVDHTTLYRWVQYYAPKIEKRLRYFQRPNRGLSWRVDETYLKIKEISFTLSTLDRHLTPKGEIRGR
jgi:IS6 family transposase